MALTPEQALNLSTFTDFQPLVNVYLDSFLFLVLFDPSDPLVSDFTPTTPERDFIVEIWNEQRPRVKEQLSKVIRLRATVSLDTAGQVIQLLRAGANGTVNALFNIFKSEIPKLALTSPSLVTTP